ncbi:transglycosylase domain-containing protein [Paenibacillus sp.]|uniref:transglycosylase domain-containing protein n=1 Tax=Paenibacillus sp. TaxID=58172 RepID=UPI0028124A44|nr:transglycosylase domain-containing protein [Paenibacillus sp.]
MNFRRWVIGIFSVLTLGLLIFIAGYFVIYMNGHTLLEQNQEKLDMAEATVVYDRNGEEFARLMIQNRELVTLDEVPDKLEQAMIATEDQRFESHAGVDFWSIGRAIVKDIIARDLVEGGSTITQQVAKNMFLNADKTFFRKATEVSIALALENNFEKDQILEMYLNRIYFGNGAYGVKAAAERHFGKDDLEDLSLLEIAVLAGMPKAPNTYSPTNNPDKALERAAVVLSLMKDQGYITEEERREALNSTLGKPAPRADGTASAMRDYVLEQAALVTGKSEEELRIGGYEIHTTVDAKAQRAMDEAFANPELFPEDGPKQIAQGAMVIVEPKTGGIVAMNGGRNYVEKGYNRALADRQPGSSFKPIAVYGPALETGEWQPYSILKDEKMSFGNYSPSNLSGKYAGEMTMMEAVRRSINLPTVWLLNEIGVDRGLRFAKDLGIDMDAKDRNLAIALGGLTHGASPLEMARAYGAFANNGVLAETHVITEVLDTDGHRVYTFEPSGKRVMSERTAYYSTVLLEAVTQKGGTGTKANFGRPIAGKTGTTQLGLKGVKDSAGNRDIWFVGYTPQYAAAVWMGFDETNAEHYVKSGSGTAAAMFAAVMKKAMDGMEVQDFNRPSGVEEPKEAEAPAAIADLSGFYDVEKREAVLTWSAVPEAEGIEYRLYRKVEPFDAPAEMLHASDSTTVIDISGAAGKKYMYYVTAYAKETELESAPSNVVEIVVPGEGEGAGIGDDLPVLPDILPGEEGTGGDGGDDGQETDGNGNGNGTGNGSGNGNGGNAGGTGGTGDNAGLPDQATDDEPSDSDDGEAPDAPEGL